MDDPWNPDALMDYGDENVDPHFEDPPNPTKERWLSTVQELDPVSRQLVRKTGGADLEAGKRYVFMLPNLTMRTPRMNLIPSRYADNGMAEINHRIAILINRQLPMSQQQWAKAATGPLHLIAPDNPILVMSEAGLIDNVTRINASVFLLIPEVPYSSIGGIVQQLNAMRSQEVYEVQPRVGDGHLFFGPHPSTLYLWEGPAEGVVLLQIPYSPEILPYLNLESRNLAVRPRTESGILQTADMADLYDDTKPVALYLRELLQQAKQFSLPLWWYFVMDVFVQNADDYTRIRDRYEQARWRLGTTPSRGSDPRFALYPVIRDDWFTDPEAQRREFDRRQKISQNWLIYSVFGNGGLIGLPQGLHKRIASLLPAGGQGRLFEQFYFRGYSPMRILIDYYFNRYRERMWLTPQRKANVDDEALLVENATEFLELIGVRGTAHAQYVRWEIYDRDKFMAEIYTKGRGYALGALFQACLANPGIAYFDRYGARLFPLRDWRPAVPISMDEPEMVLRQIEQEYEVAAGIQEAAQFIATSMRPLVGNVLTPDDRQTMFGILRTMNPKNWDLENVTTAFLSLLVFVVLDNYNERNDFHPYYTVTRGLVAALQKLQPVPAEMNAKHGAIITAMHDYFTHRTDEGYRDRLSALLKSFLSWLKRISRETLEIVNRRTGENWRAIGYRQMNYIHNASYAARMALELSKWSLSRSLAAADVSPRTIGSAFEDMAMQLIRISQKAALQTSSYLARAKDKNEFLRLYQAEKERLRHEIVAIVHRRAVNRKNVLKFVETYGSRLTGSLTTLPVVGKTALLVHIASYILYRDFRQAMVSKLTTGDVLFLRGKPKVATSAVDAMEAILAGAGVYWSKHSQYFILRKESLHLYAEFMTPKERVEAAGSFADGLFNALENRPVGQPTNGTAVDFVERFWRAVFKADVQWGQWPARVPDPYPRRAVRRQPALEQPAERIAALRRQVVMLKGERDRLQARVERGMQPVGVVEGPVIQELERQLRQDLEDCERRLKKLGEDHDERIRKMQQDFGTEKRQFQTENQRKIDELKRQHVDAIRKLREECERKEKDLLACNSDLTTCRVQLKKVTEELVVDS